ncbi:hypothetical protein DMENIID0001_083020 [Sergentomyia squamirostris]
MKTFWWIYVVFLIYIISGPAYSSNDDLAVARWILALDSAESDPSSLPGSSSKSSSGDDSSIPSLESFEDQSQKSSANEPNPSPKINIPGVPDIGAILKVVEILKKVGSVVVPVVVDGIEATAGSIQNQLPVSHVPDDVMTYSAHGIMLLQNAKRELKKN